MIETLSCSSITQEKFFHYEFDTVSINDFSIKNDDGPINHISGETYLFHTDAAFGHSLMDIYAQFKMLKLKYKNIQPFFYETNERKFNQNKITIDQMNSLGYEDAKVFDISVGNYSFEKVIMFFDMNLTFPQEFYSNNGATRSLFYFPFCNCPVGSLPSNLPCGQSEHFKYNYLAIDILKHSFKHLFNNKKTENIFVSRERYNKRHKEQIELYSKKESLSDKEKECYWFAKWRYSEKDEYIQEIFKNNGYTIIYPEDYSLLEQIKIFSSAKNIAGLSGTWLFNSFWANEETSVFEISAVPNHRYHYKQFVDYAGVKHSYINVVGLSQKETIRVVQERIDQINKNTLSKQANLNTIIDMSLVKQAISENKIHIFKNVFKDLPSLDTIISVVSQYVDEDLENFPDRSYLLNDFVEGESSDMRLKCRFWSRMAFQLYDPNDKYMSIIPELDQVTKWGLSEYSSDIYDGNFALVSLMKNRGVVGSKHSDYVDQFQWVIKGEMVWRTGENLENEYRIVEGDFVFIPKNLIHEVETIKAPRVAINLILRN
jgi:mannose-6-phosphate isomerase-like protein (cupin superfamily)